jgi:hypothetical protein
VSKACLFFSHFTREGTEATFMGKAHRGYKETLGVPWLQSLTTLDFSVFMTPLSTPLFFAFYNNKTYFFLGIREVLTPPYLCFPVPTFSATRARIDANVIIIYLCIKIVANNYLNLLTNFHSLAKSPNLISPSV